jgi:sugar phosphate isomerase/epimerase
MRYGERHCCIVIDKTENKNQLYVSTNSFPIRRLDQILHLCYQWKINGLELSAVEDYDLSLLSQSVYPNRYLVHNYFPPPETPFLLNLASQDEDLLKKSIDHCCRAIELSSVLGCQYYAVHAGYAYDLPTDMLGDPVKQASLSSELFSPYEKVYRTLLSSIRYLTNFAMVRNVRLLIENNVCPASGGDTVNKLLLMTRPEHLQRLVEDVSDKNFGLLVDVGHLKVSAVALGFDRERFIHLLSPHIMAFHLNDNDGQTDQHLPFDNTAWVLPYLRQFPTAALTIELNRASMEQIISMRDIIEGYI